MTNREWLNSLSDEKMAEKLLPPHRECEYCIINSDCNHIAGNCYDKIAEWLGAKYEKPMPKIKEGDYILYEYSNVVYRAFCVYGNIVYLIDRGVCTNFEGEIKENTIAIKRFELAKRTLNDIWRADNEN